jgi:glycyl-tRNA synthetase beta chain
MMAPLLVELQTEELPPKSLPKLGEAFATLIATSLRRQHLVTDQAAVTPFASPRRLAVLIGAASAQADDQDVEIKLMPASVGLDASGAPTPALVKRLLALGAQASASVVAGLERRDEGKATVLYWRTRARGATLAQGLQTALDEALAGLPIAKVMTYPLADGWQTVAFVRPAHGLMALHGREVVPVQALGLQAGRQTCGHRFEALVDPVVVTEASAYEATLLEQGRVIASFEQRRRAVADQIDAAARKLGLKPIEDAALLDEVTALVERPNVLTCAFEPEFLSVPPECLVLTMKANQKYFPLVDAQGQLTEHFLVVSNVCPADASRIVQGNQRVVRPRLADAKFFFDKDRKTTLASRLPQLDRMVYHAKLGSMGDRVRRLVAIAGAVGQVIGGATLSQQAAHAASLAKVDLVTDMVGEFPELQGIMGHHYALHDGESATTARAIEDHYKPRFAGDALPREDVGLCVALADKLETLVGLFAAGEKPTGDKDPFALRRHALGVIRMLIERDVPLALPQALAHAATPFSPAPSDAARQACEAFIMDRLTGYLRELGHSAQAVQAVVSVGPRWGELPKRLEAVRSFSTLLESAPLAAANKRVGNILKKGDAGMPSYAHAVDVGLLQDAAERELNQALERITPKAQALYDRGDYAASLCEWAALKAPVDAFFERVMVHADDPALRRNRLTLLSKLHAHMNRVADLAQLAV